MPASITQVGRGASSSRLQRAHRLGRWCCSLGAVASPGTGRKWVRRFDQLHPNEAEAEALTRDEADRVIQQLTALERRAGIAATAQPCAAGNGPDRTGSRTRGHRACEQCPPSVRSKHREKWSPTIARKMATALG